VIVATGWVNARAGYGYVNVPIGIVGVDSADLGQWQAESPGECGGVELDTWARDDEELVLFARRGRANCIDAIDMGDSGHI
jgi:hypothetical protein